MLPKEALHGTVRDALQEWFRISFGDLKKAEKKAIRAASQRANKESDGDIDAIWEAVDDAYRGIKVEFLRREC